MYLIHVFCDFFFQFIQRGAIGFGREEEQQQNDPMLGDRLAHLYAKVAELHPHMFTYINADRSPEEVDIDRWIENII